MDWFNKVSNIGNLFLLFNKINKRLNKKYKNKNAFYLKMYFLSIFLFIRLIKKAGIKPASKKDKIITYETLKLPIPILWHNCVLYGNLWRKCRHCRFRYNLEAYPSGQI